jgi:hypothetical protein
MYKIIFYIILFFIIVQIIRQTSNIITTKFFPVNCKDKKRVFEHNLQPNNILIIGDDNILGKSLYDCESNISSQLFQQSKANVYTFGNAGLKLSGLVEFINNNWFEINKKKYNAVIISVGANDIIDTKFNIDSQYLKGAIQKLKEISDNIFVIGPYDIDNNKLFVFPMNLFIKYRVNELYNSLNDIAGTDGATFIDIRNDITFHCKKGDYCRGNGIELNADGIAVVTDIIINKLTEKKII